MCDPISAGIASVVGTAASVFGSMQQAKAQQDAAQAVADQNRADQAAQQAGFVQRIQAGNQQTAAQTAASQETLSARSAAADAMRSAQSAALQRYQDTLNAENTQSAALRQTGDTAAQNLVAQTSGPQLDAAQQARLQATQALVGQNVPPGPTTTDPSGSTNAVTNDLATGGALARRTAEAATNIRNYGAKIAATDAYGAPLQQVGLSSADTAYGIMPARTAAELLSAGSGTRLLPTQVAYQGATGLGSAQDVLLQSKGQGALDTANLTAGNAVDLANLQQSNATTLAANAERQRIADDQAKAAQAGILSGIGKLGAYGGGYFGGFGTPNAAPGFAAGTGSGAGIFTNLATGATTDIPGVTMPNAGSTFRLSSLFT
jgi:hypothetical protein